MTLEKHVGQLETALERISRDDQAKTDFIAILAHELRNPLSPIVSALELMKLNGVRAENQPHVASIASHVHTMARLLDDLLDISRISLKRFKLQKEMIEARVVVERALEMVHPFVENRRQTLVVTLPQEELWLHADPVRMGQIVVNLLNNAAKYTQEGGRIELSVERRNGEMVLMVSDNGMGIPKEHLPSVFEPFGGGSPARGPTGLRIGLSLAQRMAQMHRGSIEAHSGGEGKGARFVVCIPLSTNMPLPLASTTRNARSRFSPEVFNKIPLNLSILVVDDNEPAAQSLARLLEHGKHKVWVAYDAPEALELARQHKPDVALLDIGLPTMDGYELARRMREVIPDVSLVALTGFGQTEDKQKARDAGFAEHLVKPVSIVDVERVLSELRTPQQQSR